MVQFNTKQFLHSDSLIVLLHCTVLEVLFTSVVLKQEAKALIIIIEARCWFHQYGNDR